MDNFIRSNFKNLLLIIFILALAFRVIILLVYPITSNTSSDSGAYKRIAERLAAGEGISMTNFYVNGKPLRSYRPPLTPILSAGFLKLTGGRWLSVHLFFCFIGALGCLIIALVAR
ncbi:hypothetical protein GF312_10785, partial [Candidatus Poribacteria bacterium]|nr:hypothetical protein [Candidatus Poribacteria bacterium]